MQLSIAVIGVFTVSNAFYKGLFSFIKPNVLCIPKLEIINHYSISNTWKCNIFVNYKKLIIHLSLLSDFITELKLKKHY